MFGVHLSPKPRVVCDRLWGFFIYRNFIIHDAAPEWVERRLDESFNNGGYKEA